MRDAAGLKASSIKMLAVRLRKVRLRLLVTKRLAGTLAQRSKARKGERLR